MAEQKTWMRRLADEMQLETEPMPGCTLVEAAGDQRVLIEHHGGVTAYSDCLIGVRVSYGNLEVEGTGLEIARLCREQLVICGRIDCIRLCRKGKR